MTSFSTVARSLAEVVDAIMSVPRPRARRIDLITHQIRRALVIGYRAAKTKQNYAGGGIKSEPEG